MNKEEIKKLASLSRLTLNEDEIQTLSEQISHILKYVEKLNELDLSGVKPMAHAVTIENVFRPDDTPHPSDIIKTAISNAPEHDSVDMLFRVPKVIG